jgi:hypothetical protein
VFIKRDANETFQVLYPLHKNKSTFDFEWVANQNAACPQRTPSCAAR